MKRLFVPSMALAALLLPGSAPAQRVTQPGLRIKGSVTNRAVMVASDNRTLEPLAVTESDLTNSVWVASRVGWQAGYTNLASFLENWGRPNGIAKLDENGKIDADLIETITVVFAGGEAVDVP